MNPGTPSRMHRIKKKTLSFLFAGCSILLAGTLVFSVNTEPEKNNDINYRQHIAEHYKIFSLPAPEALSFAGERVPIEDVDIRERLDKELTIQTYWHSQTLFMMKRANRWFPLIEAILKEEGIPDDFKYVAAIESNFEHVVSPAGASGFWQFMKTTGIGYGLEINTAVDERYNLEKATRAACRYFKDAYKVLGNWTLVAASYNMGISGVQNKLKEQGVSSYYDLFLNTETHRYVFRLLAVKEVFGNPSFYGFNIRPQDLYAPYLTREVEIDSSLANLSEFSRSQGFNLKIIKLLNPWLRDHSLPNKNKKVYKLKLPQHDFHLKPVAP